MGRRLTLPSIDSGDIYGVFCCRGIYLRSSSMAVWVKGQYALSLHTIIIVRACIASKRSVVIAGRTLVVLWGLYRPLKMTNVQGISYRSKVFS